MTNSRKKAAAPKEVETLDAVKESVPPNANSAELPQETPAPAPQFSISDMHALQQIAEVAVQRGAYRVEELEVVGRTISRLKTFLSHVAASQSAPDQK